MDNAKAVYGCSRIFWMPLCPDRTGKEKLSKEVLSIKKFPKIGKVI